MDSSSAATVSAFAAVAIVLLTLSNFILAYRMKKEQERAHQLAQSLLRGLVASSLVTGHKSVGETALRFLRLTKESAGIVELSGLAKHLKRAHDVGHIRGDDWQSLIDKDWKEWTGTSWPNPD